MPKRKVIILDKEESPWPSFLEEFFSDTQAELHFFHRTDPAGIDLSKQGADVFFVKDSFLNPALAAKLRAYRSTVPAARIFELQTSPDSGGASGSFSWDFSFQEPLIFLDFQRQLMEYLPLPEKVRVLVVDDEREIGAALAGYLQSRSSPRYEVEYAENGEKGLRALEHRLPDAVILDVKMPGVDGREVFRTICEKGWTVPVIVHFDAIFGDEMMEIHKIGNPAIVEKGSRESSLPEMEALIKKMVYFA